MDFFRIKILLILSFLFLPLAFASQKVEIESIRVGVTNTEVTVAQIAIALPATAQKGRKVLIVTNSSSNTIYLGDANVTTSNGTPLEQGQSFMADITEAIVIYGISVSGNNSVRVLELR